MFPTMVEQGLETQSTIQLLPLGTVWYDPRVQGKKGYIYVEVNGQSAMTAGLLLVGPAAPSNSTGLAIPSTNTTAQLSLGSRQIIVTNGGTAITTNQFQDGDIELLGTNGVGQKYTIAGNTADSTGTGAVTVNLVEPLRNTTALVAGTNTANLRLSKGQSPTASLTQGLPVGVTIAPWASTSSAPLFGWLQMRGPAFIFATSGTKGYPVCQDTSGTAGYVVNTGSNLPQIGVFQYAAASSLASVDLQIN